jgi:hypothetical protein
MEERQDSVELVLAHTWAEIREIMGHRVPALGISVSHVPGRYIFTHPSPSNVLFWWYEIVDFARTIELGIRSAIAANVFLRQSASLSTAPIDDVLERALLERDYHAESSIAALYAMREKISWLVFELIHPLVESHPRQRQVSYARILRWIDPLLSEGMFDAHYLGGPAMLKVIQAFRELGEPGIARLFEFRHALTHHNRPRFQPRFDQPPVIGRNIDGGWEIHECGSYRFRFVEHLTLAAWSKYVEVLREMAACAPWEAIGLKLQASAYDLPRDAEQLVHSGRLAVDMGYGTAFVRCMKQCRGVDISLEFKEPVRDTDFLRRVLTNLAEAFVPILGNEPGERIVIGGQEEGQDRQLRVLLLIDRDDRVQSLSDAMAELDRVVCRFITGEDLLRMLAQWGYGQEVMSTAEAWLGRESTVAVAAEVEEGGSAAKYCVLLRRESGDSPGEPTFFPLLYQRDCGRREEDATGAGPDLIE